MRLGWISNVAPSSAISTDSTARPGRTTPSAATSRGTRRIGPSVSAAMASAPKPAAASASGAAGTPMPGARHSPGRNTGCRDRTGVIGRLSPSFLVSSTNPGTDGAAANASANCLSPSGAQRSRPPRNRSRAMTDGRPDAAASTRWASCARGHGHAPTADNVLRSISTITMSAGAGPLWSKLGRMRSNSRSRGILRNESGASTQAVNAMRKARAPAKVGHGMRR